MKSALPDAIAAPKRSRKTFCLIAETNSGNSVPDYFATTLEQPFDDRVTASDLGWNNRDAQFFALCAR